MLSPERKDEIEREARRLRLRIWERHLATQGAEAPRDRYELVEPDLAAEVLDFDYLLEESLGRFGERGNRFEVAGAFDSKRKVIQVSRRFSPEEMRFTGAHEIGHLVLHPQQGPLHRDRPLSHSSQLNASRPLAEQEADYFTACFLIPDRLLERDFKSRFGSKCPFELDERAALFLHLEDQFEDVLDGVDPLLLARALAVASSFNGEHFCALVKRFRVSASAMALRLIETGLVYR